MRTQTPICLGYTHSRITLFTTSKREIKTMKHLVLSGAHEEPVANVIGT